MFTTGSIETVLETEHWLPYLLTGGFVIPVKNFHEIVSSFRAYQVNYKDLGCKFEAKR